MSERKIERRGLGRGLSALMAEVGIEAPEAGSGDPGARAQGLRVVPIEALRANPDQPRRSFDERTLAELAESIKEKGIVQPLIVRAVPGVGGEFEIVAGERRWRAAQLAQLSELPVVVREFNDQEVLEIAIIENIQREGLNAIDEASGYRQLIERFGHTQEKVASALGKSRSHIANQMRLLSLPNDVQSMIVAGTLTAGHARALITAADPAALAVKVVGAGLSVRETERLAREVALPKGAHARSRQQKDADTRALEADLSANLGLPVTIDHQMDGNGKVTIRYSTIEQLDQLCQVLSLVQ